MSICLFPMQTRGNIYKVKLNLKNADYHCLLVKLSFKSLAMVFAYISQVEHLFLDDRL